MNQTLIKKAIRELQLQLTEPAAKFNGAEAAKAYLTLKMGTLQEEHFVLLLLNSQNALIKYHTVSTGTINQCPVYPREVLKAVIKENAAAVILAHNHPSGCTDPSDADILITQRLVNACGVIDVPVLDHIIVAGVSALSFEEEGIMPSKKII